MLRNYFKIAWRNLTRNKSFAIINTLGLALGFTCCILIFLFVKYHLSFDDFHDNSERIFRIVTEEHRDFIAYEASVPPALGRAFRDDYDYPEKVARIDRHQDVILTISQNDTKRKFKEELAFVEKEFFEIFNYPLLSGNSFDGFSDPNRAFITSTMASKLFGGTDPIGQSIQLDNRIELTVSGVLKDLPPNTIHEFDIYISYSTLKDYGGFVAEDGWGGISSSLQCFTLLKPGISPQLVESELQKYVAIHRPNSKNEHHYKLQHIADIHYNTQYDGVISHQTLIVFSFIGLFLIIAACINFINMSTAQAISRSREVGVQKVLGSYRWQLFRRFMSETALLSLFSLIIGFILSFLLLPYLNLWFDVNISSKELVMPSTLAFISALYLSITVFSGLYPGLLLSGISPVLALKGKLTQQHVGGLLTRKSLIITQFVISQMLIVGMIVIGKQMHYALNTDLGFNKEAIITVEIPSNIDKEKRNDLKNRFLAIPGVEKVSACLAPPSFNKNWGTSVRFSDHVENEEFSIQVKAADQDYLETFDLKLIAGRNYFPSDSIKEFVVNEMLVRKLNLKSPEEVVGKALHVNRSTTGIIVGVVSDFHNMDLRAEITPIFITNLDFAQNTYSIKINLNSAQHTISQIEDQWSREFPNYIFDYEFLDAHIARFYESETRTFRLIQIFTFLAIFISCLGMFGLISFLVGRRLKEVGVRKVLGGSIAHVLWLFLNDFFKLVILAAIVAVPVSWFVMDNWLQNFQFKIEMGFWIFGLAVIASLVITIMTVGFQSIKAALTNPADVLRTE
ncbi:MAG: ABC transporter permease [Cyclobacteriaceae bacterium]